MNPMLARAERGEFSLVTQLHQSRSPQVLSILPHGDNYLVEFHWIRIATLTWVLPLNNSCLAGGAKIGTVGLVSIHYWWKGVEGKCLLWSSKGSSNALARWRSRMLTCDNSSNALEGRRHRISTCDGGGSNATGGGGGLQRRWRRQRWQRQSV